MLDLLIRNGRIIDGTGAPWFRGDVGVVSGRIAALSPHLTCPSRRTLEAKRCLVTPGFIDTHSHGDYGIISFPTAENLVRQGITTSVLGNCGVSLAPFSDAAADLILSQFPFLREEERQRKMLPWQSFGEYLDHVEAANPAVNIAAFVGHGALRALVMGHEARVACPEEARQMQGLLRICLEQGAFGMSTGLIYPPGVYSTTDELIALADTLADHRRLYATHVRSETDMLIDALNEALEIAKRSGVSVHISHHKAAGQRNWGTVAQSLACMEAARSAGIDVTCDVYPYTAGSTTLSALLPPWAGEGGAEGIRSSLSDPSLRSRIAQALDASHSDWENLFNAVGPEGIVLSSCPNHPTFEGQSLTELSTHLGKNVYDTMFDLIAESPEGTLVVLFEMSEEDVTRVVCHRLSTICCDGNICPASEGRLHPRTFGSFIRALVGTRSGYYPIAMEEMIRKMTSFPAQRMGLLDRGILREGLAADILVFSEEEISEGCDFDTPNRYAGGMSHVLINGTPVIEEGKMTGARPGMVFRASS